jgi:hypothetical protein
MCGPNFNSGKIEMVQMSGMFKGLGRIKGESLKNVQLRGRIQIEFNADRSKLGGASRKNSPMFKDLTPLLIARDHWSFRLDRSKKKGNIGSCSEEILTKTSPSVRSVHSTHTQSDQLLRVTYREVPVQVSYVIQQEHSTVNDSGERYYIRIA